MKISSISNTCVGRVARRCMVALALACPAKTANEIPQLVPKTCMEYFHSIPKPKPEKVLKIISDTNFAGGITRKYDEESVQIIKNKILKTVSIRDYTLPIENAKNVYLEAFGMYMAKRPEGKKIRPHLGLDIFVTPFSRKPKTPIEVLCPIDGIVISRKVARKTDNVISNTITVLGIDGRRYAFDHLARETDYPTSIPLPKLGSALKKGDKIGYVGKTGETTMWHLHFVVMTDEQLAVQKSSKFWLNLEKNSKYCTLKGQVNPLDENEAGAIAILLGKYRRQ